jgi:hypothetical protein
VRKRFGYDDAKAAARAAEQARQAAVAAEAKRQVGAKNQIQAEKNYQDVIQQAHALSGAVYDSGRWYSSAKDAHAARQEAIRSVAPRPHAPSSSSFPCRSKIKRASAVHKIPRSVYFRTFTSRKPILFWATRSRKQLPRSETS